MQSIDTLFVFSSFSIPPAISAVFVVVIGALVYRRERRSEPALLFFLLTIALAVWLLSFALMYSTEDRDAASACARMAYLGIAFIPTLIFHFTSVLLHREDRVRGLITLHWVLSVLFVTLILTTDLIVSRVVEYSWGFYPVYARTGVSFLTFFFFSMASSMWAAIKAIRNAHAQEFGRLRGIASSLALGYLALTDFLPSFGVPIYPMGYIAVLAFSLGVTRTISRYHLIEITPRFAVEGILETIRGSVLVTGVDGAIRVVSDATCDLLGYTEGELVGRNIDTITPRATMAEAGDYEDLWQTKNGDLIDVVVTRAPIGDVSGRAAAIVYSAEDIRHRKREEALRESESRYRTLVEGMNEGVIVVDNDHIIRFVNRRVCEMLGYDANELQGQEGNILLMSDDDRRAMQRRVSERIKGLSDQYTVDMRRKDGTALSVEISAAPLTDGAGTVVGSIGICVDMTEKKRAEAAIRESEARYRLMAEHATDMISRVAPDGTILYTSPACTAILGYTPEEMEGTPVRTLVHPEDLDAMNFFTSQLFAGGSTREIRYRALRRDGETVWIEATCQAIRSERTGKVKEVVAISRDITERMRAEQQIHFQAYHDNLTGLPNRKLFDDRLTIALAHARRRKITGQIGAAAVLFLDLDHFKLVNDTFGHSAGDRLIQELASRLRSALRAEDTIARFGGDEFIVLLPHMTDSDHAPRVAQKLLDALREPVTIDEQTIYTTGSIGIAIFPEDGDTSENLLRNADAAMYRAKERARNTFQLASPLMNERARERLTVEASLHRALERHEFRLFYQPIVSSSTHAISAVEALIRWESPEGLKLPDSFIQIAEESFLIGQIGEWVLKTACTQMREWQHAGIAPPRMSINLSARQLEIPTLASDVATVLRETGVLNGSIELEITETAVLRDRERTLAMLESLKEASAVSLAVDDFGTGYSSLTYLRSFPIDRVKIDRSFVRDVALQASDAAIVGAVITMAHALRIDVVAEGVENDAQVATLSALLCDHLQGFHFGLPMSAREMTELLRSRLALR